MLQNNSLERCFFWTLWSIAQEYSFFCTKNLKCARGKINIFARKSAVKHLQRFIMRFLSFDCLYLSRNATASHRHTEELGLQTLFASFRGNKPQDEFIKANKCVWRSCNRSRNFYVFFGEHKQKRMKSYYEMENLKSLKWVLRTKFVKNNWKNTEIWVIINFSRKIRFSKLFSRLLAFVWNVSLLNFHSFSSCF